MRRSSILLPALAVLGACDGNGTSADRLRPEDVAGVYNICVLRFQPSNAALPAADLMATVINPAPPAGRPLPTIALAENRTYDLVYTARQTNFVEQIRGSISYQSNGVTLSIADTERAAALLLPRSLALEFTDSPRRLASRAIAFPHSVPREDYARAAGISQEGLQSTISGQMTVDFSQQPCT